MKLAAIAAMTICAMMATASATTLPPVADQPATKIALAPVLPAPAASRFERDYFQAPEVRSHRAGQFVCRIALRTRSATRPICD